MNEYTYDDWAEFLTGFFFDEAHDGEEILFAVDELSLAEASGLSEQAAADSLAAAVRLVIGPGWNVGTVMRLVDRWHKAGANGPHPALPFLALTVLAASRMGGYEGFAPHKFYVPLRRALVPDDPAVDAPGTYLHYVSNLWHSLARWANVDTGGRCGRLTVRDPGWQYGRGLAIQHALVKSHDLRQLDAFFRRIGLQPGEELAPAELRRALAVWTANRPERWAQRLHRISSDLELKEYAEALLAREARRWDGQPRDPRTGRAVGRIRIGFPSARRPQLGIYMQWDERLPEELKVTLPSGSTIKVLRDHGWFSPHPLKDVHVADAISAGLTLRGDGHRFELRAEHAYAVTYSDDLGGWVSVDCMSYGDRYHMIVWRDVVREVVQFVTAESATAPRVDEMASKTLPPGWTLIADVRIDARPRSAPPRSLATLIPAGAGPRLRLFGGLPLTTAHGVYLRGGEPALALSTVTDDDRISLLRPSTGQVERFRVTESANREVPLWKLQLEPDVYEIRHGESMVTLQIVDGIAEAAGPGAGTVRLRGRGTTDVIGTQASTAASRQQPITVPAPMPGDSVILLGACPGEHHRVEVPTWLSSLIRFELSWKTIDAWPEFDPVWLLLRGESSRYEASLLAPIEPSAGDGSANSNWARLIAVSTLCHWESDEAATLWARYRTAVGVSS
jgi:hypothetical protein